LFYADFRQVLQWFCDGLWRFFEGGAVGIAEGVIVDFFFHF